MQKFSTVLSQGGVRAPGRPGLKPSFTLCTVYPPLRASYLTSMGFSFSSVKRDKNTWVLVHTVVEGIQQETCQVLTVLVLLKQAHVLIRYPYPK